MDDRDSPGAQQRAQTDESLRTERERADLVLDDKLTAVEQAADEVVRVARARANAVLDKERRESDCKTSPQSTATKASAERERKHVDVVLVNERAIADRLLDFQRAAQKRYLADFLTAEREATDQDLVGERAHADTAIAAREEVLATVSHDLRSMLAALTMNADLLIAHAPGGDAGAPLRRYAEVVARLLTRMRRLISDLLDSASIDAGKLAVVREPVDVGKLVRDTLESFAPIAAVKRVLLEAETLPRPLQAQLDGGRILQVLANLVSNAIKFTAAAGRVVIGLRLETGAIHFSVSDTGIGMSEEELGRLFERFSQIKQDRRGLGLGLYISKRIVEAHGGRMWAESKTGSGSTFHFVLPA